MLTDNQRLKLRVFVKTYLSLKNSATAKELSSAANTFDIGINNGITSNEMARLLRNTIYQSHSHFLDNLSYRKTSKGRVYFLKKEE